MKISLYIEDGLEQIVLTPTSETEKGIVGKLADQGRKLEIKRGGFWVCAGGYYRHDRTSQDESIMIVLRPLDKGGAGENP